MQLILPNFLIALREGVEAALVVGIIVAYINKIDRKDVLARFWVGVVLAAAIPLGLGVYWTWGPVTITFQAQEILGGVFSIIAALFVTWMIFWMGKNSRQLTANIHAEADQALETGNVHGLIWMGIVSVAREGAETAVMVWGVVKSSGSTQVWEPTIGVVLGLVAAVLIGYLIYRGSLHMNIHTFFTATGYLLIFVAAGIFLYGFHDLQEASVLPGWGVFLWDQTAAITPLLQQWWFVILNAFFNLQYLFQPTLMQIVAWIAYLVVVLPLYTLQIQGKIFTDKRSREEVARAAREKVSEKAE